MISTLCYSKIFVTLRQNQAQAQHQHGQPDSGGIPFNIARFRETVATAIWVEVTLIAYYLPYAIFIAAISNHGSSPFLEVMWQSTVILVCLNSSLSPAVY